MPIRQQDHREVARAVSPALFRGTEQRAHLAGGEVVAEAGVCGHAASVPEELGFSTPAAGPGAHCLHASARRPPGAGKGSPRRALQGDSLPPGKLQVFRGGTGHGSSVRWRGGNRAERGRRLLPDQEQQYGAVSESNRSTALTNQSSRSAQPPQRRQRECR